MTEDQQLDDLTERLRRRVKGAPPFSQTARAAQEQLDAFAKPSCPLTTAQKIAALTSTLRTFWTGLQHIDPVLFPPDRRKS